MYESRIKIFSNLQKPQNSPLSVSYRRTCYIKSKKDKPRKRAGSRISNIKGEPMKTPRMSEVLKCECAQAESATSPDRMGQRLQRGLWGGEHKAVGRLPNSDHMDRCFITLAESLEWTGSKHFFMCLVVFYVKCSLTSWKQKLWNKTQKKNSYDLLCGAAI